MKKPAFVFAFFLSAAAMAGEGHTTSKPEHPSKPNTPAVVAPVALATSTTTVKTGDTKAVASTGPITINVEASSNSGKGKGKGGGGKKPEAPSGGSGSGSGGNTGNVLSASTGDQIFAPVIGWGSGGFGGSGTTTIKNVADPNPPSMPAVTPCTTGASAGVGWAGGVFSFGGYYKDLMCLWERMHAVAVATNDEKGASEIREGMTMMLCEDTPPERRKFFKQCEALARAQSEGAQPPRNPAFNSD